VTSPPSYYKDDAREIVGSWNAATGRFRKVFLDEQQRVIEQQ